MKKVPTNPKQGDLFWINPQSSKSTESGSAHPYVVIQDDTINESRVETVVVCALTSNRNRANESGNILLDVGEGNLPLHSIVVVSQIETVRKDSLGEYIGTLSEKRIEQIFNGMRFQQRSFFRHFRDL